jgi:predicted nucleic acid-binding protein
MGVSLLDQIPEGVTVTIDTAPLIYYFEGHPKFSERYAPLFEAIEAGRNDAVVSTITLAEVLCGPFSTGKETLATRYRRALTDSPGWRTQTVTDEIAELAARFKARYRLKLPDALQLATTLATGSHALVTHDRDFSRVQDVPGA